MPNEQLQKVGEATLSTDTQVELYVLWVALIIKLLQNIFISVLLN